MARWHTCCVLHATSWEAWALVPLSSQSWCLICQEEPLMPSSSNCWALGVDGGVGQGQA